MVARSRAARIADGAGHPDHQARVPPAGWAVPSKPAHTQDQQADDRAHVGALDEFGKPLGVALPEPGPGRVEDALGERPTEQLVAVRTADARSLQFTAERVAV